MNYLRVNDASGGYGGYPWDRGFGIMDGPAPNSGAVAAFTQAIDAHATADVPAQLLSNRSAAYMGLKEHSAVRQNAAELFDACRQRARHVRRMWNRR